MHVMRNMMAVGAILALAGCAYEAKPISTGSVSVVSSFTEKLPGRYALYIETTELSKVVRAQCVNCAAHTYPLDMSEGFRSSVRATFANLIDTIEEVPAPLDAGTLQAQGFKGQIIVRGDSLEGKLVAIPGFWQATISSTVRASASVIVDGQAGRLVGKTVEGMSEREADAGAFCSGGAAAVDSAASEALRKLVMQLGETVSNSERLRAS